MDFIDFLLSAGPAFMGIALQKLLPSEKKLIREARATEQRISAPLARSLHHDFIGVAAVASIPVAFAGAGAGLVGLVWAAKASLSWVVAFGIAAAILGIMIASLLSGKTFYEIAHDRLERPRFYALEWLGLARQPQNHFMALTAKHAIDYSVYVLNGALVLLALVLYVMDRFGFGTSG